jgi:hypothetical protein
VARRCGGTLHEIRPSPHSGRNYVNRAAIQNSQHSIAEFPVCRSWVPIFSGLNFLLTGRGVRVTIAALDRLAFDWPIFQFSTHRRRSYLAVYFWSAQGRKS